MVSLIVKDPTKVPKKKNDHQRNLMENKVGFVSSIYMPSFVSLGLRPQKKRFFFVNDIILIRSKKSC